MSITDDHYRKITCNYDRLAVNGIYATQAPQNRGGRKAEYICAVFDAALKPWLQRVYAGDNALDFGCGTGVLTRNIAGRAGQVTGLDISLGMLKYAKNYCSELNNIIFLQVDGQRLPLPDSSFDWAVARESLCYVPDLNLAQILAEFHRILKPGGRLLLLDQFSDNPYWQNHPGAPNMIKRAPQFILEEVHKAGFIVEVESKVRSPRFIWIYALQFGLLPRWTIPYLARWEVAWHVRFPHKSFRWWNELFVLRRAGDE